MRRALVYACLCWCPALSAQKMPVAGAPGRLLQIIDLQALRPEAGGPSKDFPGVEAFVRGFVAPPLGSDDDVRLLGRHQLAVLGSAQQAAFVENLVAKAMEHRNDAVTIDVRLVAMAPALFDRQVRPLFGKEGAAAEGPLQAVLGAVAMQTLRRASADQACRHLQAMVVSMHLLEQARLELGKKISYADYLEPGVGAGPKMATPLSKVVFDGQTVDVMATILGKDQIAVQCDWTQSEVEQPLPEAKVSFGAGEPVTIQLPRVRIVHFLQRAMQPAGSSVVIATRRQDGEWLVAVLTAFVSEVGQGR